MGSAKEFVESLTDQEKRQIVAEYDQFEKEGFIGESFLRTKGMELADLLGDKGGGYITMWMRELYVHCLRYFYDWPGRALEHTY
jgi:hypothetical protein